jgi:hypothetical protein
MTLPSPGKAPCVTCPYRRDVASGIWSAEEYAKLPRYDGETGDQIMKGGTGLFFCHQNDGKLCAGWVACHDMQHVAAARFNPIAPEAYDYRSPVPVFASGAEAAAHGMVDIHAPGDRAQKAITRLLKKAINQGGKSGTHS